MKSHNIRTAKIVTALALLSSIISYADGAKHDLPKSVTGSQFIFAPFVPWQLDDWNTKRLLPGNPDKPLIDAEVAELIGRYEKSDYARANVTEPVQLQTGVLHHLFPRHRFYLIGWGEKAVEGKKAVGLAMGLYYAFIVGPNNQITRLSGFGNFEEYGQFLSKNGIRLRSAEDARELWLAFCDIHQHEWHSRDLKRISAAEWHLGLYETDEPMWERQHHYWYRVILDADQKVISAKMMFEDIKKLPQVRKQQTNSRRTRRQTAPLVPCSACRS